MEDLEIKIVGFIDKLKQFPYLSHKEIIEMYEDYFEKELIKYSKGE